MRAVSAAAGRVGIRAGMTIAEARAICAELHEYPWDDVAVAAATTEMTALLLEASPQVTPVAGTPGLWWVGASGFGGRGGVYHSQYDDWYWMTHFGDPGFRYHATAAKISAVLASAP